MRSNSLIFFASLSVASMNALAERVLIECKTKAQGGTCDSIVTPAITAGPGITQTKLYGTGLGPGKRVCLAAGTYPYASVIFENFTGSAAAPVEFINCGGKFILGNNVDADGNNVPDSSRGMSFINSKYIKVSGTGSADQYGIKMAGASEGQQTMIFTGLSSDMEVEFVEISNSAFAGIMAKTDPGCSDTNPNSFRPTNGVGFVQKNSVFHDNYIHDVKGEGLYLGFSFFTGYTTSNASCPGTKLFSHPLDGVKVYNNRLENIGCEAIQIGIGSNSDVHDNYIRGYGVSPFAGAQNNGIQIGLGSSGKVYNNYIENPLPYYGVTSGIIIQGYKDTWVYGNTIVNPGSGIYIHKDQSKDINGVYQPYKVWVANNTIYNVLGHPTGSHIDPKGIWSFNASVQTELKNNVIFLADAKTNMTEAAHILKDSIWDQATSASNQAAGISGANIVQINNAKKHKDDADLFFIDPLQHDFRLLSNSAFINAGQSVSSYGMIYSMRADHANRKISSLPRVAGSSIDMGASEYITPTLNVQESVSVAEGGTVTVTITSVDTETISASGVPSFAQFSSSGGEAQLVINPNYNSAGTYQVSFQAVNDDASSSKTLTINVSNVNRSPEILPVGTMNVKEGESKQFSVFAADPDGDALSWSVSGSLPAFVSFSDLGSGQAQLALNPSYSHAGLHSAILQVQDSSGQTDSVTVSILVEDSPLKINDLILINADSDVAIGSIGSATTLSLDLIGTSNLSVVATTQAQGVGSVQFKLNGTVVRTETWAPFAINGDGQKPNGSPDYFPMVFNEGVYLFEVTPYSGANGSGSAGETKSVSLTLTKNHPPVLQNIAAVNMNEGTSQNISIVASDPDGDVVSLSAQNLPSFVTLVNSSLQIQPLYSHAGQYSFVIEASDPSGLKVQKTVSLSVSNVNRLPTITASQTSVTVTESQTLDVTVSFSDPDQETLTISEASLPSFVSVLSSSSSQKTYRIAPVENTVSSDETFVLEVIASDGEDSAQVSIEILVKNNILMFAQIKINFTTASGPNADSSWSQMTAAGTIGAQLTALKDNAGVVTPYGIELVQRFTSSRGSLGGTDGGKLTGNNSGMVPDSVLGGVWYIDATGPASMRLEGLDSRKVYRLKFVSSRASPSGTKATIFASQGKSVQVEALNNTSNFGVISGLIPDAQGQISFTVEKGAGSSFGYLNGLIIEEYLP